MKNKFKIHKYAILNYKYSAKKTTGQWMYIFVQGDQRVNSIVNSSYSTTIRNFQLVFSSSIISCIYSVLFWN